MYMYNIKGLKRNKLELLMHTYILFTVLRSLPVYIHIYTYHNVTYGQY